MKAKMKLALAKSAHKSAAAAPAKATLPAVKINSQKKVASAPKAAKKDAPVSLAQV